MSSRFDGVDDELLIGSVGVTAYHQLHSHPAVVRLHLLHHLVDRLLGNVVLQPLLFNESEMFLL